MLMFPLMMPLPEPRTRCDSAVPVILPETIIKLLADELNAVVLSPSRMTGPVQVLVLLTLISDVRLLATWWDFMVSDSPLMVTPPARLRTVPFPPVVFVFSNITPCKGDPRAKFFWTVNPPRFTVTTPENELLLFKIRVPVLFFVIPTVPANSEAIVGLERTSMTPVPFVLSVITPLVMTKF